MLFYDIISALKKEVVMRKLYRLINGSIGSLYLEYFLCFVLILASSVFSLGFPYFLGVIIDQGSSGNYNLFNCTWYVALMATSGLLMTLFQYLQNVRIYRIGQKFTLYIKNQIYAKCVNGNWRFWSKWKSGDVLRILGEDIQLLEGVVTIFFGQLLVNILLVIGLSILICYYDITIGIISIVSCWVLAFIQKKLGKRVQVEATELRQFVEQVSVHTNETVNNIPQFVMEGIGNKIVRRFSKEMIDLSRRAISQAKKVYFSRSLGMLYNVITVTIVLCVGLLKIQTGKLTIGVLYSITIFVQRLYAPALGICDAYITIKKSVPVMERINRLLESEDEIEDLKQISNESQSKNIERVDFNQVCFNYDSSYKVIQDMDFHLSPNMSLGIIGENGTGKTTIIKLLTKLCKPSSGTIILNNINIEQISKEYLDSQISVMSQDSQGMSGTIRSIIDLDGKENDDKLHKLLNAVTFDIDKYSDGLDTIINTNKINISGGEKQKLELARVIIEDRPFVILDEPTSAFDMESEEEVCKLLLKVLENKIAIIITHRKSILSICDSVIEI